MRIQTNSGNMLASKAYHVPELGEAHFNEKNMTNIIGLNQMRTQYRVTYDSENKPAFFMRMNDKAVKFPETDDGLYALNMENNNKNNEEKRMVIANKDMSQLRISCKC